VSTTAYAVIWVVLLLFPIGAAVKKMWWPCAIYAAGALVFLYNTQQNHGGWDDLANLAILAVVVAPIYLVATVVWIVLLLVRKNKQKP